MDNQQIPTEFDVVILGAGFAGICQARHLLLNIPGIRVALVQPLPIPGADQEMGVGESMAEIAGLFVNKELGLHDYMIEQHAPKQGLSFHWPRCYDKTDSLDDYFHVWVNREGHIANFHLNREKFERDVRAMTVDLGAVCIQGHVLDVDLTCGDAVHTISVQNNDGQGLALKAKHVVDAAGQRFIIGNKTDNLLFGAEHGQGDDSSSARVRIRRVDRTVFLDSFNPGHTTTSRYYCTHYWFGHGHWLWQIPSWSQTMELSLGLVYHHEVIPPECLNSREKFYNFLKENHNLLYRLATSGEEVEFVCRPRLDYLSQVMFSPDNWYVIGDAAYSVDAIYAYDTTAIALAVESVTEIIRATIEGDSAAEMKRNRFNDFNLSFARLTHAITTDHVKQFGHASAMSWRIYFEHMWWFGLHLPMYVGKWHLDPDFIKTYLESLDTILAPGALFDNVYATLNEVVDRGLNIGLLDVCRTDQMGSYDVLNHDYDFRSHPATEPKKCNVFSEWKLMLLYMTWWYARLQWNVRGFRGVLAPKHMRQLFGLLKMAGVAGIGDISHRLEMFGKPKNTVAARNMQASLTYRRQPVLQPWGADIDASTNSAQP